jgi:glycosyltransferase involved in cell wall biosynthesis
VGEANVSSLVKGHYRLFYGGIIGYDRGLKNCIDALQTTNTWQMDIFGQGPAWDSLMNQLPVNVKMHGVVSHPDLMQHAQNSDLYVALYDPKSPNNVLTASNKLFEAAQLGIPLLTNKGTGIGELVEKYQLGWVVRYGDVIEIEKALQEFSMMTNAQREKISLNLSRFYEVESSKQEMQIQLLENRIKFMLSCETA